MRCLAIEPRQKHRMLEVLSSGIAVVRLGMCNAQRGRLQVGLRRLLMHHALVGRWSAQPGMWSVRSMERGVRLSSSIKSSGGRCQYGNWCQLESLGCVIFIRDGGWFRRPRDGLQHHFRFDAASECLTKAPIESGHHRECSERNSAVWVGAGTDILFCCPGPDGDPAREGSVNKRRVGMTVDGFA